MYLDTCIVAKLIVHEADSAECADAVTGVTLVSSELVYTEISGLLLRKQCAGEISRGAAASAWLEFERLVAENCLWLAPLDTRILRQARTVMLSLPPKAAVRTLDAIHLATYLSVVTGPFFTKDAKLKRAAQLLSIPTQ